jgi:hypothetical protein
MRIFAQKPQIVSIDWDDFALMPPKQISPVSSRLITSYSSVFARSPKSKWSYQGKRNCWKAKGSKVGKKKKSSSWIHTFKTKCWLNLAKSRETIDEAFALYLEGFDIHTLEEVEREENLGPIDDPQ